MLTTFTRERANRCLNASHAFILTGVLWTASGCERAETMPQELPVLRTGNMDVKSLTLEQVRTQASFYAEVVGITVEDGTNFTNFLGKHGLASRTAPFTNFYVVYLLGTGDQKLAISDRNATTQDLDAVRRLEKGKSYTFPDAVVK
jgi:hypothetical protein